MFPSYMVDDLVVSVPIMTGGVAIMRKGEADSSVFLLFSPAQSELWPRKPETGPRKTGVGARKAENRRAK